MRALAFALCLLPGPLWAEEVALFARPTAVTVYPSGALVSREMTFDLPQGRHSLILGGLPDRGGLGFDVTLDGATLIGATYRQSRAELPDDLLPQPVRAAKTRLADLRRELARYNGVLVPDDDTLPTVLGRGTCQTGIIGLYTEDG